MLKEEKLAYQKELEEYMEENKVYEIFEGMMISLMTSTPKEPIPFLLDALDNEEKKKNDIVVIMGPPQSNRKEHALALAEYFGYESISVGDMLNKEVRKKQDIGQRIVECKDNYVDDDIVIDLVKKLIPGTPT